MRKKSKVLLLALSGITLVAISSAIGFLYGFRQGLRGNGLMGSMGAMMQAETYMTAQLSNAGCDGVKTALQDYLATLEKYKDVDGSFISGKTYYIDAMIIHTRLARIAKGFHNDQEAADHMKPAVEACGQLDWKDCSEDKLIQFTRKSEEKNPIPCLKDLEK